MASLIRLCAPFSGFGHECTQRVSYGTAVVDTGMGNLSSYRAPPAPGSVGTRSRRDSPFPSLSVPVQVLDGVVWGNTHLMGLHHVPPIRLQMTYPFQAGNASSLTGWGYSRPGCQSLDKQLHHQRILWRVLWRRIPGKTYRGRSEMRPEIVGIDTSCAVSATKSRGTSEVDLHARGPDD